MLKDKEHKSTLIQISLFKKFAKHFLVTEVNNFIKHAIMAYKLKHMRQYGMFISVSYVKLDKKVRWNVNCYSDIVILFITTKFLNMSNILFRPNGLKKNPNVERLNNTMYKHFGNEFLGSKQHAASPVYANIQEKKDRYIIFLTIPGFEKSDVNIVLNENKLTVSGKKENVSGLQYHMTEFQTNFFERVFYLSDDTKNEDIQATAENGILQITIMKKEQTPPLQIEVK